MREKIIFHIDVNSAFLSWSAVKRLQEDPESVDLRTIPAVVGGDPTTRHGIVTAKSLPAKKYGIHTADTIASAMRRCPGLVVIPSDFATYREYSHRFLDVLRKYTSEVEQASIDEAYMDATGLCDRMEQDPMEQNPMEQDPAGMPGVEDSPTGPRGALSKLLIPNVPNVPGDRRRQAAVLLAAKIRQEIRETLGFTVNVGISSNRLLAKMASDFQKPDRTHTLFPEEVREKMWPLPIGDLYGCGSRTAARLLSLGIRTIGDAANAPETVLTDHLGEKAGKYIHRAALGMGRAAVYPVREDAKSYSNEFTTSSDIRETTYESEFLPLLRHLCEKVAGRLQRDGVYGKTVVVTVKTDDFRRRSAQARLSDASNDAEALYTMAAKLSDKLLLGEKGLFAEGAGIRLVGAGVTDLDDGTFRQVNLFDWMQDNPETDRNMVHQEAAEINKIEGAGTAEAAGIADAAETASKAEKAERAAEAETVETAEEVETAEAADINEKAEAENRTARLREMETLINRRFGDGAVHRGAVKNGED